MFTANMTQGDFSGGVKCLLMNLSTKSFISWREEDSLMPASLASMITSITISRTTLMYRSSIFFMSQIYPSVRHVFWMCRISLLFSTYCRLLLGTTFPSEAYESTFPDALFSCLRSHRKDLTVAYSLIWGKIIAEQVTNPQQQTKFEDICRGRNQPIELMKT